MSGRYSANKDYGRYEYIMKNIFLGWLIFKIIYAFSITITQISCTKMTIIPQTYAWVTLSVSICNLTLSFVTFFSLFYMCHKYHKYVYECISRKQFKLFVINFFSYGIAIFIFTVLRLDHIFEQWLMDAMLFAYLLNFPIIIMSYAILYLKNTDDVIQEVSKLDNLLIVSLFQRHKLDNQELKQSLTNSTINQRKKDYDVWKKQLVI